MDQSYFLFDPISKRMSQSRNVTFNENEFPCKLLREVVKEVDDCNEDCSGQIAPVIDNDENVQVPAVADADPETDVDQPVRRSARACKTPAWFGDFVMGDECNFGCDSDEFQDVPGSLEQVLASSEKGNWLTAMKAEFDALVKNGTWKLSTLPEGKKPLGGRWVFREAGSAR